jgi:8-oxo-dGTP pyrophosphatase MutT (NUDIX family)
MGGHADGDPELLEVARREVEEESGITQLTVLEPNPVSIENIPVLGHFHRTRGYVSAHIHLNITFLFEASENSLLRVNADETSGVKWLGLNDLVNKSTEEQMKNIYRKIIDRIPR